MNRVEMTFILEAEDHGGTKKVLLWASLLIGWMSINGQNPDC